VTKDNLSEMVSLSNVDFRKGSSILFSVLEEKQIPCLILSAGFGNMLEEILHSRSFYRQNVKVISNFLVYDEEGNAVGISGPREKDAIISGHGDAGDRNIIHVFNKNARHAGFLIDDLKNRNNVILMGDSLGDLSMAQGLPQLDSILKIGFLNEKIEERLMNYMENFDVVLVDDQTMDFPNFVIDKINK